MSLLTALGLPSVTTLRPSQTPDRQAGRPTTGGKPVKVEITTKILAFDPQPGTKSTHTILVDFEKKKVTWTYVTGKTIVAGVKLDSVRDKFQVDNVEFSNGRVGFDALGETATGVRFLPNINYKFAMAVTPTGSGALSGSHDGYPAYEVVVAGKKAYSFDHKKMDIAKLCGDSDVVVATKSF